jgi:hypothetical protein
MRRFAHMPGRHGLNRFLRAHAEVLPGTPAAGPAGGAGAGEGGQR